MVRRVMPATGRRLGIIAIGLTSGLLSAAAASAQPATPAAAAPPQQAQAAANQRLFPNDGALWLNFVKPDKVADFEFVVGKLKEALQKSDKPERKQQAAGWKVYKNADAAPAGGNVLFVFVIEPAVKGADYLVSNLVTEAFGNTPEANDILKKYAESFPATGAMNIVNLQLLQDLSK